MQAVLLVPRLHSDVMGRPSSKPRGPYGRHLMALREAAGLTQNQLADRLSVDQSNIAFWERGDKPPRGEVLAKLAQALNVSVDELLGVKKPRARKTVAKGRLQQLFSEADKLPRRQQQKIVELLAPFVHQQRNGTNGH